MPRADGIDIIGAVDMHEPNGMNTMPEIIGVSNLEDYVNFVDNVNSPILGDAGLDNVEPNTFLQIVFLSSLGYKNSVIANKCGITYRRLGLIMKIPQFIDMRAEIKKSMTESAQNSLAMLTVEAAKAVGTILRTGKNKEKLTAAEIVFDRGGVVKQSTNININQKIESRNVMSEAELATILGIQNPDIMSAIQARGVAIDGEPTTSGEE